MYVCMYVHGNRDNWQPIMYACVRIYVFMRTLWRTACKDDGGMCARMYVCMHLCVYVCMVIASDEYFVACA